MKKSFYFMLLLSFLFIGIACNNPKRLAKKAATETSSSDKQQMRFIVSFYSKGSGPDYEAKKLFLEFINKYQEENKIQLKYNSTKWGREGEEDFCFPLTELNAKKQLSFIEEIKNVLKGSNLVNYRENVECKK